MDRVLIAGGGTGGHLYPGLAVAGLLKRRHRGVEVHFVGTARGLESRVVPKEGYHLHLLPVQGLPRKFGVEQLRALWGFARSSAKVWRLFLKWKPDVIVGTGGYVSAPPIIVGRLMRIPILLQEQNAVPGAVNRLLAPYANEVHLNFAAARTHFRRRDHLRLTGNPLRSSLLMGNRQRAFRRFGFSPSRRTLFVMGGSHGAHTINEAIVDALERLPANLGIQCLIQTGRRDAGWVRRRTDRLKIPTSVHAYLNRIDDAYTIADLIVCRGGAMTLSEVTASGLAAVIVPYPHAVHNHQELNGTELVERQAAVMIRDADLAGDNLADELKKLLSDPRRLRRMGANAHGFARFDGAERLVNAIEALVEQKAV